MLRDVLSGALRLWDVAGTVEPLDDGLLVTVGATALRIVPTSGSGLELKRADAAIQDLTPVRWLVLRGAETLGEHAGVPGLLRHLRDELAPQAKRGRLIIGAP
jgi:hypothetical protein